MAIIVDSRELVNYRAIKESLISKGYDDKIASHFAESIHKMDNKIVARFCVHSHMETNMGNCSHWFASKLKNIPNDWTKLSMLVTTRDIFPELAISHHKILGMGYEGKIDTDNGKLSSRRKMSSRRSRRLSLVKRDWTSPILDMMDLELTAMENALEEAYHSNEDTPVITSKESHYARACKDLCETDKGTFINWYLQKHVLMLKNGAICKMDRNEMIRSLANGKCKNDAMMRKLRGEVLILRNYWTLSS